MTGSTGVAGGSRGQRPSRPISPSAASKDPVRVGVIYFPGFDEGAAALGLGGLTTGDTSKQTKAVTDWINAHGGLGGHPITLFKYDISSAGPGSGDHAAAAACEAMARDYKVRYVLTIFNLHNMTSLLPCLAKHGIAVLNDQTNLEDSVMARHSNFLANPGEFAPGRRTSVMVDDLVRRGWLTPSSKVGVLAVDSKDGRRIVDGVLAEALRRHGLRSAMTQYVNPESGGDGGNAQQRSAALKFATADVDRVVTVLMNPLYFMLAAEAQQYRPAYALNSDVGPGALLESAAPGQMANMAGIGWLPYNDIGKGTPHGPVSPRETLCFEIMRKSGQAATSPTVKAFVVQICNTLFYLKDVSDRLPALPQDMLTQGRALLGTSFVSADTFRTDVRRRTDGAAGYRPLAWQTRCQCVQYVGPVRPAG